MCLWRQCLLHNFYSTVWTAGLVQSTRKWMYESGEDCKVVLEIEHLTWSGNIVYIYWCKIFGWVALSLSLLSSLSLSLPLTLSLWGFTSHCSARESVRTFVVVMVTDIKRWLDCSWIKDWIGLKRESADKRYNLLNQDGVPDWPFLCKQSHFNIFFCIHHQVEKLRERKQKEDEIIRGCWGGFTVNCWIF